MFCSHSIITFHTHFIVRMLTEAYLMHFRNFTEYENIEYEVIERTENKRYFCRVNNEIYAHF